jgi:hypothetical protein
VPEDATNTEGTTNIEDDGKRWVKEVRNGTLRIVPYDTVLHNAKTKYYYNTYADTLEEAEKNNIEIYFNDSGTYKKVGIGNELNTTIKINYNDLKVSFCEYDYNNSIFEINSSEDKQYLNFDCNKPIEGYFDLEISAEVYEGETLIPAVKERYVWWKAPVTKNYNLTENMLERIGMLFYTDKKEVKNYPIIGAQLFKYKTYKSNDYETLINYKI